MVNWVAKFGCPIRVTTDRGTHFEAAFSSLLSILGIQHVRTTAYHPESNGMVERFHRQLKTSLRAQENPNWHDELSLVLLSLRNTTKEDLDASPAQLVFGTALRLPGEMVHPRRTPIATPSQYASRLARRMRTFSPTSPRPDPRPTYIPTTLPTTPFVFLRTDSVKTPLQPAYTGPFKVLLHGPKTFVIDHNGRRDTVSIDRLKPAFLDPERPVADAFASLDVHPTPACTTPSLPAPSEEPPVQLNRRGGVIRPPVRFDDNVRFFPR